MLPRLGKNRLALATVLRSAGVGAIATLVDFAVLGTLVSGLGHSPRVASPIALVLGLSCQFFGNKLFAFEDRRPAWARQAAAFIAIELLAFAANLALFDIAVRTVPAPYLLLRAVTQAAVYFGVSLPLWSRLFEKSEKQVAS